MFGLSYLFRDVCSIVKGALFARDTPTGNKLSSSSDDDLSTSRSDSLDTMAPTNTDADIDTDVDSTPSSRLLDLPAELRNKIWALAVSRSYRMTIKQDLHLPLYSSHKQQLTKNQRSLPPRPDVSPTAHRSPPALLRPQHMHPLRHQPALSLGPLPAGLPASS